MKRGKKERKKVTRERVEDRGKTDVPERGLGDEGCLLVVMGSSE